MELIERSYSTNIFRPRPLIHWELEKQLLIVATNWGSKDVAEKIIGIISKYVIEAQGDMEATTLFESLPQLTNESNSLRIACLLANESCYRYENQLDYLGGIEVCLLLRTGNKLSWLQVGQPHLFVKRSGAPIQTLSVCPDLGFDYIVGNKNESPLPKELLGVDTTLAPRCGDCLMDAGDEILMVSRSQVPNNLGAENNTQLNLAGLTMNLSEHNTKDPFWVGIAKV